MKTTGIIVLIFGIFSTLRGFLWLVANGDENVVGNVIGLGLAFVVLGIFLINRAKKKKEEEKEKREWEQGGKDKK